VINVAPARFYRPYYTFRPRLNIGFGLWVGVPIAYPYYYGYYNPYPVYGYPTPYPQYGYPYPPANYPAPNYPAANYPPSGYPPSGYPPSGSVGVQGPNEANTGGISFVITPSTAEVYVDGQFLGQVGQFTATSQPLGLTTGRHHVEIRASGYRTVDFDVDIVAGQVIPYEGTLER
jgi:hypothetical protein